MRAGLVALALCAGVHAVHPLRRSVVEPYAPYTTSCSGQLVRKADSLNEKEAAYIKARKPKADEALLEFLSNAFDCFSADLKDLPTIGIALSGGGSKGALVTLGVLRAFDSRERDGSSVGGILQSASYITALSGGTIALSALLTNNNGLPSKLYTDFFQKTEENAFAPSLAYIQQITEDVSNKTLAGYPASILDVYGRIISYSFYGYPPSGDDGFTLSGLAGMPFFDNHEFPLPFYVVSNSDVANGQCSTNSSGAVWEVSPYEWGSFDTEVGAFYPTKYMGTTPGTSGQCTQGFDNIGFITASSCNILVNASSCGPANVSVSSLNSLASPIYLAFPAQRLVNPYGIVPNPFYQDNTAGAIRSQQNLYWADGGFTGQVVPSQPLIEPERDIDVVLLVDTQSNGASNITNGAAVYASYLAAQARGLTKMPPVPNVQQFAAQNLASRPSFYGCYNDSLTTMVFLPDTGATLASGFTYTPEQVNFLFTAGYDQGTAANSTEWAGCLACAIMHKTPYELPDICQGCLSKYCWTP